MLGIFGKDRCTRHVLGLSNDWGGVRDISWDYAGSLAISWEGNARHILGGEVH